MPEDHSELVPLLPIPNRTVKRLSADDSADTRVKVGHSQAIKSGKARSIDRAFFVYFSIALTLDFRKAGDDAVGMAVCDGVAHVVSIRYNPHCDARIARSRHVDTGITHKQRPIGLHLEAL